jgi:hypothetical protein
MTTEEFSNEFDVLYNSFAIENNLDTISDLNEYEKSVFLTEAQNNLVIDSYKGTKSIDAFESTEEIRRYLSNLVVTKIKDPVEGKYTSSVNGTYKSQFFELDKDLWFIIYESAALQDSELGCYNGNDVAIIPTTLDELHRTLKNPFRGTNHRRVLRLDYSSFIVELVSKFNIESYLVKYIRKPKPIILTDLDDFTTIEGYREKSECELNSAVHRDILERAVTLAVATRKKQKVQNTNV